MKKTQVVQILEDRKRQRHPKNVTAAFVIREAHDKAIRDAAERAGVSQSDVVRAALDQFFEVQPEAILETQ